MSSETWTPSSLNVVTFSMMTHCFHSAFTTPIATQPQMHIDSYPQKSSL